MKARYMTILGVTALFVALLALAALATTAEMYFSSDKNGANRVTNIQEGDEIWICVYDPDENIDCDLRDKIWTDIKLMDPKTGAYIVWISYKTDDPGIYYGDPAYVPYKGHFPGSPGSTKFDYLEETGADTGLFVSERSFQVGTRASYTTPEENTHVVDNAFRSNTGNEAGFTWDFQGGNFLYFPENIANSDAPSATRAAFMGVDLPTSATALTYSNWKDKQSGFLPPPLDGTPGTGIGDNAYLLGRFENMDTLVGMYVDQNDNTDVAVAMAKIIDTKATISWDQEIYKDANASATITVVDPDENLNCNQVEYVPVWILVDPGSWNVQTHSATNFCMLKRYGGVNPSITTGSSARATQIRWYNIYYSGLSSVTFGAGKDVDNNQPTSEGAYYVQYPKDSTHPAPNVTYFDTADPNGYARVMFYAQETGPATGVFQLNLNSLLGDLGFNSLKVHDVLVAYYLDPNDFDDFVLAPAYIEEHQHSVTSFTDATRGEKSEYWLGRDPVYVQVIDANANVDSCCPEQVVVHVCDVHGEDDSEWLIADETSSNSPVFFTNAGTELKPAWDPLGVNEYQVQLDNWKLEVYNEDSVYARYNDVVYYANESAPGKKDGLAYLGDLMAESQAVDGTYNGTAFPPKIRDIRVANDVSFAQMSIGDTQVYDGTKTNMYFLDRQGNRVSGYVNSDCVFVEVVDPDQDEDQYRRERVDAYWDGGQNLPFGPWALNPWSCSYDRATLHPVNDLLGDTNIFNDSPVLNGHSDGSQNGHPMLYVLNPRNGRWAAVDLLETGVATGDFVSVTCIDLVDVYTCVPTLGVLPGDTIVAFYQDPSNHSDSAMISIKVGLGGGGTPPSMASTTMFTDADGNEVTSYTDADSVYVKVIDPSKAGATSILDAVDISGTTYDLAPLAGAATDTFITGPITGLGVGTFTATYTDPTDPTDTSSDTIDITASELSVDHFYAGPNPFTTTVDFGYAGTGTATTFTVTVYDLSGHQVWTDEQANVNHITWDGSSTACSGLANGGYIYVVMATDGTNTFTGKGTVFINK